VCTRRRSRPHGAVRGRGRGQDERGDRDSDGVDEGDRAGRAARAEAGAGVGAAVRRSLAAVRRVASHVAARNPRRRPVVHRAVVMDDPRLAHTRWETWLQASARGGFFPLWSGTLEQLRAQARGSAR